MARILIVDDEPDIVLLYRTEFEEEGHTVETASTLAEADKILAQSDVDLMILDIRLQRESGLSLLKELRRRQSRLPVILCSAYSAYREEITSWLADAYVVKSGDLSQLKAEAARLLARATPT